MKANYLKSSPRKLKPVTKIAFEEGLRKGVSAGIAHMYNIAVLILGDKFGFDKNMISDFDGYADSYAESIEKSGVSLEEIEESCREEYFI